MKKISVMVLVLSSFVSSSDAAGGEPRENYSKVSISTRYLLAQPNASSPPQILSGLDSEIVEEYDESTLAYVSTDAIEELKKRAMEAGVEISIRDEYDKMFINSRLIDARLGIARSLPEEREDPPYAADESGTWLVQFRGPIRQLWLELMAAEGVTPVQYIAYNAFIVGAPASAIQRVSQRSFVQFAGQMHAFMKPSVRIPSGQKEELWIQLARSGDMRPALALLERLSIGGIESAPWSPAELRVEGVFDGSDVETILREPLVMALARRPKIDVSDERAAMSLTNFAPGTNPGKYKKWLGDLCEVCGNLSGDG